MNLVSVKCLKVYKKSCWLRHYSPTSACWMHASAHNSLFTFTHADTLLNFIPMSGVKK